MVFFFVARRYRDLRQRILAVEFAATVPGNGLDDIDPSPLSAARPSPRCTTPMIISSVTGMFSKTAISNYSLAAHPKVLSRSVLEFDCAFSGWVRILDQAARSIGLSAS